MGTYSKSIVFNNDFVEFLKLPPKCRTMHDLKLFIITNTKYNITTDTIELYESYKKFFSISSDTIKLSSLLSIIMIKYNNFNTLPSKIQYYYYYQKPIDIIEL